MGETEVMSTDCTNIASCYIYYIKEKAAFIFTSAFIHDGRILHV